MTDLIYNKRLEEAKELLKFIKETLDNMTTEQFAFGADKEIRNKIDEFLGTAEVVKTEVTKQEYWNNRAMQALAELESLADDPVAKIGATVLKSYVNTSGCAVPGNDFEEAIIGCEQYLLIVKE